MFTTKRTAIRTGPTAEESGRGAASSHVIFHRAEPDDVRLVAAASRTCGAFELLNLSFPGAAGSSGKSLDKGLLLNRGYDLLPGTGSCREEKRREQILALTHHHTTTPPDEKKEDILRGALLGTARMAITMT